MDLIELQKEFNNAYNISNLVQEAICKFRETIENPNSEFYEDLDLPDAVDLKEFEIRYKCSYITFNHYFLGRPHFVISLELVNPKSDLADFRYDIEYDNEGQISDDYFQSY